MSTLTIHDELFEWEGTFEARLDRMLSETDRRVAMIDAQRKLAARFVSDDD